MPIAMPAAPPTLSRWGSRAMLGILDQGLVSGTNFALNVFLARWLDLAEYGAFSVAFTGFLVLSSFHGALLLDSTSVLGVAYKGDRFPAYLRSLLLLHAGVTATLSLVVAVIGLAIRDSSLHGALLGLALWLPMILLFWLVRRVYYLETRPGAALISSVVYVLAIAVGAVLIWQRGSASAFAGMAVMGVASLVASAHGIARQNVRSKIDFRADAMVAASVLRQHWAYGKWVVLHMALLSAFTQSPTLLVAGLVGLEDAGVMRATLIFVQPIFQITTVLGTLILPVMSDQYQRQGLSTLKAQGRRISLALAVPSLAYALGLVVFGESLEQLAYAGKFADAAWLIPVLGFAPVFGALGTSYSLTLRAARRPDLSVRALAVAAPIAALVAVVLIAIWGIAGAAVSVVLVYGMSALCIRHWYHTRFLAVV